MQEKRKGWEWKLLTIDNLYMHWLSPFLRKFSRGNNNRNSRSNWFSSEQGKVLLERTDSHLARKLIRNWFQCSDLEIGMASGNQSSCKKLRCSCAKDTGDVKIQWPPKTSHSRDVRSTPHRSPMHSLYPSRTHKIKRPHPLLDHHWLKYLQNLWSLVWWDPAPRQIYGRQRN